MTYFKENLVAERYHKFRPKFHNIIKDKIIENCNSHFNCVLDVACGTGDSTVILKEISNKIIGIDNSEEMLKIAKQNKDINFELSSAEKLPFNDNYFDLITVSSAFHWFNKEMFLSEASRVLTDNGYLVIYNNSFTGKINPRVLGTLFVLKPKQSFGNKISFCLTSKQSFKVLINKIKGNIKFAEVMNSIYKEYPSPSRDTRKIRDLNIEKYGFKNYKNETFENEVIFDVYELINYLTTQSNFIEKLENGKISIENLLQDLKLKFNSFFEEEKQIFLFFNEIQYLNKKIDL